MTREEKLEKLKEFDCCSLIVDFPENNKKLQKALSDLGFQWRRSIYNYNRNNMFYYILNDLSIYPDILSETGYYDLHKENFEENFKKIFKLLCSEEITLEKLNRELKANFKKAEI